MCNKMTYNSEEDAKADIKLLAVGNKNLRKMKVYKCNHCDKWHLTTLRKDKVSKRSNRYFKSLKR